MGSFFIPTIG
jgi:ribosome biogenesis protein ENP2